MVIDVDLLPFLGLKLSFNRFFFLNLFFHSLAFHLILTIYLACHCLSELIRPFSLNGQNKCEQKCVYVFIALDKARVINIFKIEGLL